MKIENRATPEFKNEVEKQQFWSTQESGMVCLLALR